MSKKISPKAMKELINSMGGEEELRKGFERHRKDFAYFGTYHDDLLGVYPEEWVAVLREKVIAHNKDFLRLFSQMDEEVRKNAVIQHITAKKQRWILQGEG